MLLSSMNYISPICEVTELRSEGVLCQSGGFSTPVWEYDDEEQDFGW